MYRQLIDTQIKVCIQIYRLATVPGAGTGCLWPYSMQSSSSPSGREVSNAVQPFFLPHAFAQSQPQESTITCTFVLFITLGFVFRFILTIKQQPQPFLCESVGKPRTRLYKIKHTQFNHYALIFCSKVCTLNFVHILFGL